MIGQTLSHYRITAKLGEGGMGQVYRAEDTTLDREVALKILPPELAGSQERLERFQREAKTLAALDHPNIVTIHTVEEADGVHFLTMQLVEGKRLSELIPKGGMALERLFEVAIPIAEALTAAHEKGVIHRDLKPGNVMVANDGRVKVLDFGLAKLRYDDGQPGTELPTEPLTDEGRVLGTVPYMSPEQVEGKPLDHRSDLFSLGVMLYEMVTDQRPFVGDSPASVMSAILRDTPSSVTDLREVLPRQLARIIRRCLVKQLDRRFQTARELAIELEELRSEVASGEAWGVSAPVTRGRTALLGSRLLAAAILFAATIAGVLWILPSDEQIPEEQSTTESASFEQLVFGADAKGKVSASPDGRFFVYGSDSSGNWDIYLRRIAGGNAINLTEDSLDNDRQPAFSPDGESIAFRSERQGGGIFVMGATGESVRRVTEQGYFPAWSPDGTKIAYSTSARARIYGGDEFERTWIVDLSTGEERLLLDSSAMDPAWSPSGEWLAYRAAWTTAEDVLQQDLFVLRLDGSEPLAITDDEYREQSPIWAPDGRSLYYNSDRGGSRDLWKVRIHPDTGGNVGEAERITSGSSVGHASPTGDGSRILYKTSGWHREILRLPFDPVGEKLEGPPVSITPSGLQPFVPAVSPDGEWIAFSSSFGHEGSFAIGVIRNDGSGLRQVTDSGHRDFSPDWSPDGRRIAFYSSRGSGFAQGWIVNVDGGGLWHLTDTPDARVFWPKWSPDGSRLVLGNAGGDGTAYLSGTSKPWSLEPPTQLTPVDPSDHFFFPSSWSPDGGLLAGVIGRVNRDGKAERRIALYSLDSSTYRTLSETFVTDRGFDQNPQWFGDGRRLFVAREDGVFYALDTQTGERRELFSIDSLGLKHDGFPLMAALSPDNQDIYYYRREEQSAIWMLTLGEQE